MIFNHLKSISKKFTYLCLRRDIKAIQAASFTGHAPNSTSAEQDWKNFEVERPEDAVPFSFKNRFTFGLKMLLFTATGLAVPIGIVLHQM